MHWLQEGPRAAPPTPEQARGFFELVTGDGPVDRPVPYRALLDLLARLPASPSAREVPLAAISAGLGELPANLWVGMPPRIWEDLLRRSGRAAPQPAPRWVGDRERDGYAHDGAVVEGATEWWADDRNPGAAYADRLWAWGALQGRSLPRAAWTGRGEPTAELTELADALDPRPRIERGPGLLLACMADAARELAADLALTHRDAAALWGGYFLPVLAPTLAVHGSPTLGLEVPPDYLVQLGFHLMHPRAQVATILLDRLATWADSGDLRALNTVLGAQAPDVHTAMARLLAPIARAALARQAASAWDGGLGFRLLRRVLREAAGAAAPLSLIDASLHGLPEQPALVGPLAERLREAFGTAFTSVERQARGAATGQFGDLIFLRWTDPRFLPRLRG